PSIMDIVANSDAHNTLEAAINAAGLNETLDTGGPFTLFAPTDEAFAALPEGTVDDLLLALPQLTEVLLHHVVAGAVMAEDLNDGDVILTLNNDNVTVSVDGMTYMIDMATVTAANIEASNGVVHIIDMVLLPVTNEQTVMSIIENSPIHTTLETAINAAGLAETLSGEGTFTVFAPSDEVFAALPDGALDLILANTELLTNLLLGHVHEGELYSADLTDGLNVTMMNEGDLTVSNDGMTIMIDDATIFQEDLAATNGVVHVIDTILPTTVMDTITVMDIIEASPAHTTLEAAINAAELDQTLSGEGPFTVFAPTDDAFDLLPAGTVEGLLADIPALTEILLHHVVGATALSTDLNDGDVLTTLNTTELTVSVDGGTYMIDMATVTAANLEADNGVVHVIDMVLIPADPTSINEFNTTDVYMYTLNLLGEKVDRNTKSEVVIDIYTNGKTIKRLNLNK
ncbi:MAG: fasciclin domain-containing protein, partial [Flavobacteriales bacterium]|nr:fasciclin domain-containing protein [Flavobacteriales bacterium]